MGGKQKIYELMIEIGQTSVPLKAKLHNGYTHRWTVFVRGVNNSKIEHCIQRVVFQLHESFDNPHRAITDPPFQVKETGYAGFEIPIEIYFKNRDKPNHLVFVHDLCLLTSKPNDSSKTEKLKFKNPNRDFEKCLIKSGAQLLPVTKDKKEKSYSPPTKKQKSSSIIPSKDMSKQQSIITTTSNSTSSSVTVTATKPKPSSREFIDVFGAPLVFNSQKSNSRDLSDHKDERIVNNDRTPPPPPSSQPQPKSKPPQQQQPPQQQSQSQSQSQPQSQSQSQSQSQTQSQLQPQSQPQQQPFVARLDPLQVIQTKISCLSDCDRLQKIVDIIEEAGEWFNLTPKKFEFDLKRLDRKTLSKIERCLQH